LQEESNEYGGWARPRIDGGSDHEHFQESPQLWLINGDDSYVHLLKDWVDDGAPLFY